MNVLLLLQVSNNGIDINTHNISSNNDNSNDRRFADATQLRQTLGEARTRCHILPLCCAVLCCTALYCTILYYTILYYTIHIFP